MAKTFVEEEDTQQKNLLTAAQIKELDRRWTSYKNGEGKNYSWQEGKKLLQINYNTFWCEIHTTK